MRGSNVGVKRLGVSALAAWGLWLALIAVEVLAQPYSWLKWVFVASMLPLLVACIWALTGAFPAVRSRPLRGAAVVAAGVASFVAVTFIGHLIGVSFKLLFGGAP